MHVGLVIEIGTVKVSAIFGIVRCVRTGKVFVIRSQCEAWAINNGIGPVVWSIIWPTYRVVNLRSYWICESWSKSNPLATRVFELVDENRGVGCEGF